jgi:hypothetical protein
VPATPGNTAAGDIVMTFTPITDLVSASELGQPGDLPVEMIFQVNGNVVSRDNIPIDVAKAQTPKDEAMQKPVLLLGGRGLIVNPPTLILATDRVRVGVAEGWLPADSEALVAEIRGTIGWAAALASGLPTADLARGCGCSNRARRTEC